LILKKPAGKLAGFFCVVSDMIPSPQEGCDWLRGGREGSIRFPVFVGVVTNNRAMGFNRYLPDYL
jgi:hypothetical protein